MRRKIKITIVDDHPTFRKGLKSVLEDYPEFVVISEAGNGKELMQVLKQGIPDVVLLDIQMPEMNGEQTAEFLTNHYPSVKICVITGVGDQSMAPYLLQAGIRGMLSKQNIFEEIKNAIYSVMNTGIFFNEYMPQEMWEGHLKNRNYPPNLLTLRERQIVSLLCNEYCNKEIAEILFLSVRTVENHRDRIMKKLKLDSFAGLLKYGFATQLHVKFGYGIRKENIPFKRRVAS